MLKFFKKAKNIKNVSDKAKKDKKRDKTAPPEHQVVDTETALRHCETEEVRIHEIESENHNTIKISGYHAHPDAQKSCLGPEQDKMKNIYIQKIEKIDLDLPDMFTDEDDSSPPRQENQLNKKKSLQDFSLENVVRPGSTKKKSHFSRLATSLNSLDRRDTLADVAQEDAEIHAAIVTDLNENADKFAKKNVQNKTVTWGTALSFGNDPLPFKSEEDIPMTAKEMSSSRELNPLKESMKDSTKDSMKESMKESIAKAIDEKPIERTTTKASFHEDKETIVRKLTIKSVSSCKKFGSVLWKIAQFIGVILMILVFHAAVLFASHSYEKKLIRWLLNFPLLAFLLSYTQVYVMHYVVESGLSAKLKSLNLGYHDKLSYSKFAIIKASHKILLLLMTTLLQIGTGFLVYIDAFSFNMLVIVISCGFNVIVNLVVWWLIYMRRDQSTNSHKDQHRYMLNKQLANLNKIHEDLLQEFQQTKKMMQLREESKMVFGTMPGVAGIPHGVLMALALNASEGTTMRLDTKLNLRQEYATAAKNFTSAFLMLLYSLIQFLAQTQYIRLFGRYDYSGVKIGFISIGYMLISDIPSFIAGILPYWRNIKKIDEIISVIISAAVFRFIALEFDIGNDLIVVVVIKVIYKLIRVFYRILYYTFIRNKVVKKLIQKKMAEFNGLYTPDLFEKEESSLMDSLEKFTVYQFAEAISIGVFLLAITTNKYAFDSRINFSLDMSDEYFKYFWIISLAEMAADLFLIFIQVSVVKCSKLTGAVKAKKMKIILESLAKNFKLMLMINLFCFYALYFHYSNRMELE